MRTCHQNLNARGVCAITEILGRIPFAHTTRVTPAALYKPNDFYVSTHFGKTKQGKNALLIENRSKLRYSTGFFFENMLRLLKSIAIIF